MLEIGKIRAEAQEVVRQLERRFVAEAQQIVKKVLDLDAQRRSFQQELDESRAEMNKVSKSIGALMKEGKKEEAEQAKKKTRGLKNRIKELEEEGRKVEKDLDTQLLALPNLPHPSLPTGKSEEDNKVVHEEKDVLNLDFSPKPHWEIAVERKIIDWELGVKVTGAGFPVYIGKGARLQRALISYFLDKAAAAGYTEIQPPLLVNEDSAKGTGQLPDKDGQMYAVERDGLYVIPTAEVPITNLYRGDIIKEENLPIKSCGYTPCFRREAGSYGKDVKGLNRLHQFDKVELVQIAHPENSYEILEEMTTYVEGLLRELGLPFRRLLLCTGDVSFTSAKTYDLEIYSVGQERWLEVSSVSNFETYQSNRLKLRYRGEDKKTKLAHTLNGSALALPRIVAGLLELYQQQDGSVWLPEVLRAYTGFDRI